MFTKPQGHYIEESGQFPNQSTHLCPEFIAYLCMDIIGLNMAGPEGKACCNRI